MTDKNDGGRLFETGAFLAVMEFAVRWVIAGIFVYSGLVKLVDPSRFAEIISGFGLLPDALVYPFALLLPVIELIAGVGLVFGLPGSLLAIASMLVMFILVLLYGIQLGLDIDCGCFGPEDPEQAYKGLKVSLARDALMMAAVLFIYWSRGRSRRRSVV
ncbi:MAG: MauE/DoxX family redox-associated membrane protein [Desulforhopalus sp.]